MKEINNIIYKRNLAQVLARVCNACFKKINKSCILLVLSLFIANIIIAQIPTDGLVGYWPFNGNANDESGNGYNGNVNGAILTSDRHGNLNSAYNFSPNIVVPYDIFIGTGELSISLFFKQESSSNTQVLFLIGQPYIAGATAGGFIVELASGVMKVGSWNNNFARFNYSYNNNWNHLVVIKPENGKSEDISLYLNGELQSIANHDGSDIYNIVSSSFKTVFGSINSKVYPFNGNLDDIRIYDRILTAQEITALYNEGSTPNPNPTPQNAWQTNNEDIFYYNGQGNVGIGTDTPAAKLTVDGSVLATEVKVKTDISTYPDFVFKPEYKLRTIEETEQYIQENGHLPEIPKASEVEEGISLGEMNVKLLQKIEELTLYIIELKKENENQNKIIKELKQNNTEK